MTPPGYDPAGHGPGVDAATHVGDGRVPAHVAPDPSASPAGERGRCRLEVSTRFLRRECRRSVDHAYKVQLWVKGAEEGMGVEPFTLIKLGRQKGNRSRPRAEASAQ